MKKLTHRQLFCLAFDIGTINIHTAATITCLYNLEDDTFNLRVRSGFIDLPAYTKGIPADKLSHTMYG